jgi:hypothetical protein
MGERRVVGWVGGGWRGGGMWVCAWGGAGVGVLSCRGVLMWRIACLSTGIFKSAGKSCCAATNAGWLCHPFQ